MTGDLLGTSPLPLRPRTWVPWALMLFACVISALEFAVGLQNDQAAGAHVRLADVVVAIEVSLAPIAFTAVGAFIVTRRPGNRIGWLMIASGLGMALAVFTSDYPGVGPHTHHPTRPFGEAVAWVSIWIGGLYLSSLLLLLLLFPTGQLLSKRWKPVMWLGLVGWGGLNAVEAVQVGLINNDTMRNPLGIVAIPDAIPSVFTLGGLAAMLGGVLSLVLRFRSAHGDVRQQIKWFSYGASLAIILQLGGFLTGWSNPPVALLSVAAIAALPVFVGVAILRYHLYDIDVLINRTLVYGSLTASVALLYLGCVLSLQALFRTVAGPSSDLAVAISTLAIAALFQPLRRRIQTFIDRRFYRRKYDAARTLALFQTRLRNEVDLDELTHDLVGVVQDTMQPAHVSVWIRSEGRS